MRLIIFFDGQFWIGLVERITQSGFYTEKFIFGSEPKDGEILNFVNNELISRINILPADMQSNVFEERKINPKRLKKLARLEMAKSAVSTKSQDALRLKMEASKKQKNSLTKKQIEEKKQLKRNIAVLKKKQKHKGR
jgi:Protein of unknown function (DUF2992).